MSTCAYDDASLRSRMGQSASKGLEQSGGGSQVTSHRSRCYTHLRTRMTMQEAETCASK